MKYLVRHDLMSEVTNYVTLFPRQHKRTQFIVKVLMYYVSILEKIEDSIYSPKYNTKEWCNRPAEHIS